MIIITDGLGHSLPKAQRQELFEYRYSVFVERLGWELDTQEGVETDEFDHDETCYVFAKDSTGGMVGCARLLPTTRPYLLEKVFPELMGSEDPPKCDDIWELSRFTSMNLKMTQGIHDGQMTSQVTQRLLWHSFKVAKRKGAKDVISVSPVGIERLLRSMGVPNHRLGPAMKIDNYALVACHVDLEELLIDPGA